ncbi:MAG: type II secretion system protein GspC [Bdellovibrionia bacterium]
MTDDQNDNNTPETPEFEPESHSSFADSMREKTGRILAKFRRGQKTQLLDTPEQEDPTSEISMSGTPSVRGEPGTSSMRRMELLNVVEWVSQSLQSRGYAFYGKLFTLIVCCYFLADVAALMAGRFIPEPPVTRASRPVNLPRRTKSLEEYNAIFARNLFNRKGIIPGEETPSGPADMGGAPVRTSLPFNLVGTLILRDEMRSIATIEDKSASMVYPVRIDEEIPSKARILKIEPRKVIFVNTQSGRREFVDLPEDPATATRISIGGGGTASKGPGIEQVGGNQFNIARTEVDKALSDFNNILTQARAVPNFENGVPAGYKLFQIVPGSIYDKLGLKNGDTIVGVDGQPINDPAKAFELLGKLKEGASHMELAVKKPDGKTSTLTYDIH